jgi:hypothetical protein
VGVLVVPSIIVYALEREAKRAWLARQRLSLARPPAQRVLYLGLLFVGCVLSGYAVDLVHFLGLAPTAASIDAAMADKVQV